MNTSRLLHSWTAIRWEHLCELCLEVTTIYTQRNTNPDFAESWSDFINTDQKVVPAVLHWWKSLDESEQLRVLGLEETSLRRRLEEVEQQKGLVK